MTKIITRFAPSPTGLLHVGNTRTALINWLFTRALNGTFILRLDDTDKERSKPEYIDALKEDLTWLGLGWDQLEQQSKRLNRYQEVKTQLIESGRLYPCYETAEELELKRKLQLGRGQPPIYDRAALSLTDAQKRTFEAEGRVPHYRFKLNDTTIAWNDLVKGMISFEAKHLGDPVLLRACGTPTYMLPSAVDDVDMGITHVVRGEDHITNTAVQLQLFEALGGTTPEFAHLALIKSKEQKISKRKGGFEIRSLREDGVFPLVICAFFSKLGSSESIEVVQSMQALIDQFDITTFSKSSAIYELEELLRLNSKYLHQASYADVQPLLQKEKLTHIDEAFFDAVKGNLTTIGDLKEWWEICHAPLTPMIEAKDYIDQVSILLPEGSLDEHSWQQWVTAIKANTDRKGKALFMPLRLALTAKEHGPELHHLLPLLGREKVLKRLQGVTC